MTRDEQLLADRNSSPSMEPIVSEWHDGFTATVRSSEGDILHRLYVDFDENGMLIPAVSCERLMDQKTTPAMEPAFATKQLRVFTGTVRPEVDGILYRIYVGFLDYGEQMEPVAWAVLPAIVEDPYDRPIVRWLEVPANFQRSGFATELLRGIEKHLGKKLSGEGATEEGTAFCASYWRRRCHDRAAPAQGATVRRQLPGDLGRIDERKATR